jgi:hypothetical protein
MPNIYEMPLKERFEAASLDFVTTFSRKARLARAGRRPYSASEFIDDLLWCCRQPWFVCRSSMGLFQAASYYRLLETGPYV